MNLNLLKLVVLPFVTCLLFVGANAQAQEEQTETTVAVPIAVADKGPEDALGRGNP